MTARRERLAWLVMLGVLIAAFVFATVRDTGERTTDDRINAIAETIKCPTCQGESVSDSNALASREIRRDIARRVEEGQSDDEIRAYYIESYGEEIVLTPSGSGVTALVWVLPVVVSGAAVAGLVLVFRRWRGRSTREVTDDDRRLVDAALHDLEGREAR